VCPNEDWFSSFEKLDGYSVVISDDRPCTMKGICMIDIKIFDVMVRELKDVRYVPQLKRNLISVSVYKTLSFEVSIRDGVLKMIKGSMIVLKGV